MRKRLFVGNLGFNVTNADLEQMFAAHGAVQSAKICENRHGGRSKGFGFVEMGSEDEARQAIAALNGQDRDGRLLTVNEAKPLIDRTGFGER
jgi:cold-inducible RNA-binding protein